VDSNAWSRGGVNGDAGAWRHARPNPSRIADGAEAAHAREQAGERRILVTRSPCEHPLGELGHTQDDRALHGGLRA